jgi:hypothetical protein
MIVVALVASAVPALRASRAEKLSVVGQRACAGDSVRARQCVRWVTQQYVDRFHPASLARLFFRVVVLSSSEPQL